MIQRIKKFVSNYWYYYKWYVIGGLFLLFALIVVLTQSFTQEKYDVSVIWAMHGYVEEPYLDEMEKELEKYVDDIDGDGEVNVRVILVTFTSEGGMPNSDVEFSMQQKIITQLSAGDVYVIITDEKTYENNLAKLATPDEAEYSTFKNLEQYYPDNEKVDGEKYYLKDTVFTQNELLKGVIGEDTFMIIASDGLKKLGTNDRAIYEKMNEAFDRIVAAG